MMGHLFNEPSTGIHPPSALVFKDLRASWVMRTGRGPGGGRGRRGGRTDEGGRGDFLRSHRDEEENIDSELDANMLDEDSNKKRGSSGPTHQNSVTEQGKELALATPVIPPCTSASREVKSVRVHSDEDKI